MRAILLSLLLTGCVTSSSGQVNVPATLGSIGGFLVFSGAAGATGTCESDDEDCDGFEKLDPKIAAGTIITGAGFLILAAAVYSYEQND